MKKPSLYSYVTGSVPFCIFTFGMTGFFVFEWLCGRDAAGLSIIMLLMAAACAKEAQVVAKYRAYEREWNAMGTGQGGASARPWWRRTLFNVMAWIAIGIGSIYFLPVPFNTYALRLMVLAGLFLVVRWAYRRWRSRPRHRAASDEFVAICVAPPRAVPTQQQIFMALPGYCQTLLMRSATAEIDSADGDDE